MSPTDSPAVEPLEDFFHNLGVLFVSCLSAGTVETDSIETLYSIPVKKLLDEYLANWPPPAAFSWLNYYWEKIRSKIFSMDNLLHKFVTPKGQEGYGLYMASILDNIYKFGGKHDRYNYHCMFCQANIDFGVGAVERMCTVLPLVNTTHSMISWSPSPMSLSHTG
jgi:hypothetical protein